MVIVMFGSLFTFVFFGFGGGSGSSSGNTNYNGFQLIDRGTFWSTDIDGREAFFTYHPDNLGFIFVNNEEIDKLKDVIQIDVTSDFNDTYSEAIALAQFQMSSTLTNFNIFIRTGFTTPQSNHPVISCKDSSNFVPVIYFKSSNVTSVYSEENCIIIETLNQEDNIRIKDRLVYGILGII